MAMFFNKRVLTEKVSKMFDLIGNYNALSDRTIFATNKQLALLYEDNETKCVVVLTLLPIDLYENNNFIKLSDFYVLAEKEHFDYEGIAFNKFLTSNFREVLTDDINDDKIYLVVERLCQLGEITRDGIVSFLCGDKNITGVIEELKYNTIKIEEDIKNNSDLLKSSVFLNKFGSGAKAIYV